MFFESAKLRNAKREYNSKFGLKTSPPPLQRRGATLQHFKILYIVGGFKVPPSEGFREASIAQSIA
jgi:hypothetical protein